MTEPFYSKIKKTFNNSISVSKIQWNKSRQKFIFSYLCALIEAGNVMFHEAALRLNGACEQASNLRRIQRFYADFEMDYDQVALLIASYLPMRKFKLCLDRTNWQFGEQNINIMVLTVRYAGTGIPLLFSMLDKQGCSNTGERIDLLERFIRLFGANRIACLIADREFVGEKWYEYLLKNNIRFYLRIPKHHHITYQGSEGKIESFAADLPLNQPVHLDDIEIQGCHLSMGLSKIDQQEYMAVLTNGRAHKAIDTYKQRWSIEVFFQQAKTRGFNLEQTHLKDLDRIAKLFAMLSIAFCWIIIIGVWTERHQKPIKIQNHLYADHSMFRIGWDAFRFAYRHLLINLHKFLKLLDILTQAIEKRKSLEFLIIKNVM